MQLVMLQKLERKIGEKSKSIEIAKKLLKIGMTTEEIIKVTDLSKSEIEKLK